MSLPLHKQALELIGRAHRPVIVLPHGCGPDGYASAFALARVLRAMEKEVDIVAADGPMPATLRFLSIERPVRAALGQLRKFVVTLDVNKTPLEELSYNVEDGQLSVFLTPKHGIWSKEDLRLHTSAFRYDLIMTVGAQDYEGLGELFEKNTAFFYETPVINIDHAASNEQFGQVNVVDLTATSNGEVLMQLFEKWSHDLITEEIATMLLTGMIAKTQSFKSASVTPKTLERASILVRRGARRADIVDHLFRTRSVETLRLWGRALARLKHDTGSKLVWSVLSQADFTHAGADEADLPDVIDELIRNAPDAKVVVLLYEDRERHICGIISAGDVHDSLELALPFKPSGTRKQARICLTDKTLLEAEQHIIPKLKERIAKQRS